MPACLATQSIGPEIYAVFSHRIKSLLRYLNLRSPDCSETKTASVAADGFSGWSRLIEVAGGFFSLRHPHRFITGFRPDPVQIAIKTRAVFPEKHHRQRQHACGHRESTADKNDMRRIVFIVFHTFPPFIPTLPASV